MGIDGGYPGDFGFLGDDEMAAILEYAAKEMRGERSPVSRSP